MTLTLPDDPALQALNSDVIRTDLACGLFASGHVSRNIAARIAGMNRDEFDALLYARKISSWNEDTLAQDLHAIADA